MGHSQRGESEGTSEALARHTAPLLHYGAAGELLKEKKMKREEIRAPEELPEIERIPEVPDCNASPSAEDRARYGDGAVAEG